MLDPVCESCCNEVLLDEGVSLEGTLVICLQKLQFLGDVGTLLVVLAVSVYIGKESPVIKVIDGIFEEGVCHLITPEAVAEPGG